MPLKFVTVNDNVFLLLGQTLYRGSAPGPCWGTSIPQSPSLVQFYNFLKKSPGAQRGSRGQSSWWGSGGRSPLKLIAFSRIYVGRIGSILCVWEKTAKKAFS